MDAQALHYKQMRKVVNLVDDILTKILTVFLLILLLIGVYFAWDSYYVFNGAKLGNMASFKPGDAIDPSAMKTLSEDVVAWLTIDDTSIDYPIVQGDDNGEYLNKNAYGEYSLAGAIFLDFNNAPDFSDLYNVVYGHHMSGGYMFGALDEFEDEFYFQAHRVGKLTTPEGKVYGLDIFAFMHTDASVELLFNVTLREPVLSYIREHSQIFVEPMSPWILALSTCKSPLTTDRTILFASLVEIKE